MSIVPPSLTQWTEEHLSAIFEATNSQAFNQAFDAFIAPDAVITVNGVKTSVAQYKQQLQGEAFLEASATVKYDGAVEVPDSEKSPTEAGTVGVFYEATFYSELRVFGGAQASTASSSVNVIIKQYRDIDPTPLPFKSSGQTPFIGGPGPVRLPDYRKVSALNQVIVDKPVPIVPPGSMTH